MHVTSLEGARGHRKGPNACLFLRACALETTKQAGMMSIVGMLCETKGLWRSLAVGTSGALGLHPLLPPPSGQSSLQHCHAIKSLLGALPIFLRLRAIYTHSSVLACVIACHVNV